MEFYVVFEMSLDRDIMVAVFLDEADAAQFSHMDKDRRYVVSVYASQSAIMSWYNFQGMALRKIDSGEI